MKAWHSPEQGTLHIAIGKWFKMTAFAAGPNPNINNGIPSLEISIRIFRWYRVFHKNTLHPAYVKK